MEVTYYLFSYIISIFCYAFFPKLFIGISIKGRRVCISQMCMKSTAVSSSNDIPLTFCMFCWLREAMSWRTITISDRISVSFPQICKLPLIQYLAALTGWHSWTKSICKTPLKSQNTPTKTFPVERQVFALIGASSPFFCHSILVYLDLGGNRTLRSRQTKWCIEKFSHSPSPWKGCKRCWQISIHCCFCYSVKWWGIHLAEIFQNPRSAVRMDRALPKLFPIWNAISIIIKTPVIFWKSQTAAMFCSFILVRGRWAWASFSTYVCPSKKLLYHSMALNCVSSLQKISAGVTLSCARNYIICCATWWRTSCTFIATPTDARRVWNLLQWK